MLTNELISVILDWLMETEVDLSLLNYRKPICMGGGGGASAPGGFYGYLRSHKLDAAEMR